MISRQTSSDNALAPNVAAIALTSVTCSHSRLLVFVRFMAVKEQPDSTETKRLCDGLAEVMEAAFVDEWLNQPNEMLGGLKPVEAIERGQIDLVWQVLEGLRSGSPL